MKKAKKGDGKMGGLLVYLLPALGLVGVIVAFGFYKAIAAKPAGNERMQEIAGMISDGAMAFLKREYKTLAVFIVVVAILLGIFINVQTSIAYICGGISSILAGIFGMKAAVKANVRTSWAAKEEGEGAALMIAFNGGAVMGMAVAGLGLLGVGIFFIIFGQPETASIINGYAMGASSIALFARVGGGIYTKAALREMILPGITAVIAPVLVGFILGPEALAGLLAGATVAGVLLALMMANAGGAWDNAKKYIEAGNLGGKGSDPHKAAVVGDTVGDPFKDTSGPSMNILIKLMSIVALVIAPLL